MGPVRRQVWFLWYKTSLHLSFKPCPNFSQLITGQDTFRPWDKVLKGGILLRPITLTTRITLEALDQTKLHTKLQTPNVKLWTPKCNPEPDCDTLWPWPLHFGFPFCTRRFLIVLLFLLFLLSHMFHDSYTPCSIVLHLHRSKCTSLWPFCLVSCAISLETIKSQCHVSIPQFEYWNHLALSLTRLRLVPTLPLAFLYSCYYACPLLISFNSKPQSQPWTHIQNT